jgi:hypothetical protein
MDKLEVACLLTLASMVDNRTVEPETVEAWYEIVNDISFDVAREAMVGHRRESTDYLMPVHIVTRAGVILLFRGEEVKAAIKAGLIPANASLAKPLSPEVKDALAVYQEDRRRASFNEKAAFQEVEQAMYDRGEYEAWIADDCPWRVLSAQIRASKGGAKNPEVEAGAPVDFGAVGRLA